MYSIYDRDKLPDIVRDDSALRAGLDQILLNISWVKLVGWVRKLCFHNTIAIKNKLDWSTLAAPLLPIIP